LAPVSLQTGVPLLQSMAPTWHALEGVHAALAVHATHAPAWQTSSVPHALPSGAFAPVSRHTEAPLVQSIVPR
jgi:hypothetical protein